MARSFHDLTSEEKQAFRIWQSRYEGDHSTETEKAEAKAKMDEMLWSGPGAVVHQLKTEVRDLITRVTALESRNAALTARVKELETKNTAYGLAQTHIDHAAESVAGAITTILGDQVRAEDQTYEGDGASVVVPTEAVAVEDPEYCGPRASDKPKKKEGRGRPRRRFFVEKNVAGEWMIGDRSTSEYVDEGPFAKKREAEARSKELEDEAKAEADPVTEKDARLGGQFETGTEGFVASVDPPPAEPSATDRLFGIGSTAEVTVTEETPAGEPVEIPFT